MFWIDLSEDESGEEDVSHWKVNLLDDIIPPEARIPVEARPRPSCAIWTCRPRRRESGRPSRTPRRGRLPDTRTRPVPMIDKPVSLGEGDQARLHFYIAADTEDLHRVAAGDLEALIGELIRTWEDRVREGADWERPAGRAFALRVAPGETLRRSYSFRPAGRGEIAFTGFQVITRFPFGLFSKALAIAARLTAMAMLRLRLAWPMASSALMALCTTT